MQLFTKNSLKSYRNTTECCFRATTYHLLTTYLAPCWLFYKAIAIMTCTVILWTEVFPCTWETLINTQVISAEIFWLKLVLNLFHLLATDNPLHSLHSFSYLSELVKVHLFMFNSSCFYSLWLILNNSILVLSNRVLACRYLSFQIFWKILFLTDLPIHVKK